jgi:hypothetical protein
LSSKGFSVVTKAREYQRTAVSSMTTISRCILDTSASGEHAIFDTTEGSLPLIAHHANTSLVVMALVKGVEHAIKLNASLQSTPKPSSTGVIDEELSAAWISLSGLKPLLSCLLALQTTVAGSRTARRALRTLLRQYGDILMDCWSPEDLPD